MSAIISSPVVSMLMISRFSGVFDFGFSLVRMFRSSFFAFCSDLAVRVMPAQFHMAVWICRRYLFRVGGEGGFIGGRGLVRGMTR